MTYQLSHRQAVIPYIKDGGSKVEASRIFKVSRDTLYRWLKLTDLRPPAREKTRNGKIDKQALRAHVEQYPDLLLRERASHFGVHLSSMRHALKKMKIGKKKNGVT